MSNAIPQGSSQDARRLTATSVFRNAHLHRYSERMDAEIMLSWRLAMNRGAKPADILRTIEKLWGGK